MGTLFEDVRSSTNLHEAWRHVKKSALGSSNGSIRGSASEFEHRHQRHLRTIQDQIRTGRFRFDDVEGVLKDKKTRLAKGKDPRPIAIGTMRNRVVQRAVLQVLQPRKTLDPQSPSSRYEVRQDKRIGNLNKINCSPFGVGGLLAPYGGVDPAIRLVMSAMDAGATHYFQSDIKAFFTKIPTKDVIETIRAETEDDQLTDLFASALEVNLANEDELQSYARLFPKDGKGVAQGSSLSAFAGNVLLYDFDHELNGMGVTAVRYIDDIFILGDDPAKLAVAVEFARKFFEQFEMSLYPPVPGSDKAASGLCRDAFNFLGCTIQPQRCVPSSASIAKMLSDVRDNLSRSKRAIRKLVAGADAFDPQLSRSATIDRVRRKLFGWEKSFSFATDGQAFSRVDAKVAGYVQNFEQEVSRILQTASLSVRMQALGIPSTQQLHERDQAKRK
mgnify:CR=1 FL=1